MSWELISFVSRLILAFEMNLNIMAKHLAIVLLIKLPSVQV